MNLFLSILILFLLAISYSFLIYFIIKKFFN